MRIEYALRVSSIAVATALLTGSLGTAGAQELKAAMLLPENSNPRIEVPPFDRLHAPVGRAVVDQHDVVVLERLREHAVECLGDEARRIQQADRDRDRRTPRHRSADRPREVVLDRGDIGARVDVPVVAGEPDDAEVDAGVDGGLKAIGDAPLAGSCIDRRRTETGYRRLFHTLLQRSYPAFPKSCAFLFCPLIKRSGQLQLMK